MTMYGFISNCSTAVPFDDVKSIAEKFRIEPVDLGYGIGLKPHEYIACLNGESNEFRVYRLQEEILGVFKNVIKTRTDDELYRLGERFIAGLQIGGPLCALYYFLREVFPR